MEILLDDWYVIRKSLEESMTARKSFGVPTAELEITKRAVDEYLKLNYTLEQLTNAHITCE